MHPLGEQVGQRRIHRALALDPVHAGESRRDDLDREVTFAARVVPGVAAMHLAVVADDQMHRIE